MATECILYEVERKFLLSTSLAVVNKFVLYSGV